MSNCLNESLDSSSIFAIHKIGHLFNTVFSSLLFLNMVYKYNSSLSINPAVLFCYPVNTLTRPEVKYIIKIFNNLRRFWFYLRKVEISNLAVVNYFLFLKIAFYFI